MKKKDKFVNGFNVYVYVMQEIWKLLTILLIGVLFGYILKLKGPEGNHFIVICLICALFIGLLVFFLGLLKIIKREEAYKAKQKEEEKDVPETLE